MLGAEAIPTLKTNYVWWFPTLSDPSKVYIIDPGEAGPVLKRLETPKLGIAGVLVTHHHWDHTDGLNGILARYPVPVYGPPSIPQVTHPLADGERLVLDGYEFEVLAVPGHTLDHLAYLHQPQAEEPPALFCGDALFAGGCGRLFEGTATQALGSLKKLAALPDDTRVYCAHEYTEANLRFARTADPANSELIDRQRSEEQAFRTRGITLPTILEVERRTNPFLRCQDPGLKAQVEAHSGMRLDSEVDVFAALRRWKDVS